ncbi:hypothetical protein H8D30_01160 [bacterium]|nr:hypothetical protein [bacterium]
MFPLADVWFWLSTRLYLLVPLFLGVLWSVLAVSARLELRRFLAFHRGDGIIRLENGAGYLGRESLGLGQGMAKGTLLLSKKKVAFMRGFPRREVELSLTELETATLGTQFLGQSMRHLIVTGITPKGRVRFAFVVQDIPGWIDALEGVEGGALKGAGLPQIPEEKEEDLGGLIQ